MQITELRIAGFKSFVDPQDVPIQPGLTGIVGPNGCGKSNLLEALRWAMGASSARAMRGGEMDDLIFSGADGRPARETAEVTLVLDNSKRTAPPEFNASDTLEIIRRLKRGAGSTYKLNGRTVRGKDIQLLFADASTGANSPALVRQGQISELIGSKPQNRRRILEEAAGIAGLNSRRHEAELKLNGAETNLERLSEVSAEVERQLASLKRQAAKARRYKRLSEEIHALDALIAHLRWHEAKLACDTARTQLDEARRAVEEKTREDAVREREAGQHPAADRLVAIAVFEPDIVADFRRVPPALEASPAGLRVAGAHDDDIGVEIAGGQARAGVADAHAAGVHFHGDPAAARVLSGVAQQVHQHGADMAGRGLDRARRLFDHRGVDALHAGFQQGHDLVRLGRDIRGPRGRHAVLACQEQQAVEQIAQTLAGALGAGDRGAGCGVGLLDLGEVQ